MTNSELKALCEKAGTRLTNKPCKVRFQEPAWKGAKGTACKRDRTAVIDIKPGMSSADFLNVLVHELGHVKVLWTSWTVKVPDFQPGSLSMPAAFNTSGSVSLSEMAANQQAQAWLKYAEENAGKYEGTWLERRLKALSHYMEPELKAIMNKAVNQAVQQALEGVKTRQGKGR